MVAATGRLTNTAASRASSPRRDGSGRALDDRRAAAGFGGGRGWRNRWQEMTVTAVSTSGGGAAGPRATTTVEDWSG